MTSGHALVTGAGTRLGRAMALALARRGHDVVVHYATSKEAAADVVDKIAALGQRGVALQADLLDESATMDLMPRAAEAMGGPIRVLVNNASIFEHDTIHTATRESWDRHFGSNLRAPFMLLQALADMAPNPTLDQNGEPVAGALAINMIDQRVRKLTPDFMTYTLAKAGLWTLTQTAAQALAPRVRVNAIGPGPTMQASSQSDAHFTEERQNTILQRGANSDDINAALEYFLSAPAVTGQLLCVDGGQHLCWKTHDEIGMV